MISLTATQALWFLPLALPICVWVAISDMRSMKIPNKAVIALFAAFTLTGFFALGWPEFPWRYLHLVVVLIIGFALNMAGLIGAGDAKFAAVMAPFVALSDLTFFMVLFAAVMLLSFAFHRLLRALPMVRAATPEWASWTSKKFPMGLALSAALIAYLALGLH